MNYTISGDIGVIPVGAFYQYPGIGQRLYDEYVDLFLDHFEFVELKTNMRQSKATLFRAFLNCLRKKKKERFSEEDHAFLYQCHQRYLIGGYDGQALHILVRNDKIIARNHKMLEEVCTQIVVTIPSLKKTLLNLIVLTLETLELGTGAKFPIKLAWTATADKIQGATVTELVCCTGTLFGPGRDNTQLLRISPVSDDDVQLCLMDVFEDKFYCDEQIGKKGRIVPLRNAEILMGAFIVLIVEYHGCVSLENTWTYEWNELIDSLRELKLLKPEKLRDEPLATF
ncbi:unnamed protein product [Didymodactylos carnosus]|uniref:Uncharacterized protein n=1 Tax=Didymodactylos carnosus TaxID=1234261 RepID=A0A814EFN2_9BILA|nr:unnamed protein product [Didymodactylos carnosus]CAF3741942.1 unnamed protein product [Didymodactylos carnosus]